MKRKERKEKIKSLKKTNPAFSKGTVWTKLSVVMCLLLLAGIQGYMYWYLGYVSEIAAVHFVLQSLAILILLRGGTWMIWIYGLCMASSFGLAYWMNMEKASVFYQVQMGYFLLSFVMMLFLLVNKSARTYRSELKKVRKMKLSDPVETEPVQEIIEPEEVIEEQDAPAEEKTEAIVQNEMLQVSCPPSVQLTYGSFSRFLVQHYPFVYLHPQFDINHSPYVQMCILAEGFDKNSEDQYSGEFFVHQEVHENERMVWIEYTNEMSRLCALICADWLVMQKATLLEDGINVSQQLMKQLTEAFVLAKDAEKTPFEGFKRQG